jgi:hypothetical protein
MIAVNQTTARRLKAIGIGLYSPERDAPRRV